MKHALKVTFFYLSMAFLGLLIAPLFILYVEWMTVLVKRISP